MKQRSRVLVFISTISVVGVLLYVSDDGKETVEPDLREAVVVNLPDHLRASDFNVEAVVRGSGTQTARLDPIEREIAAFVATIEALPLDTMIADFYATKSERAGRYVIQEVLAHEVEKKSSDQALVHAKYRYKKPGADKSAGEDRRAFTLAKDADGNWQIARMGFAGSGRID